MAEDDYITDSQVNLLGSTEKAPPSCCTRAGERAVLIGRWIRKEVVIEPLIIIYMMAVFPLMTIRSQYMYEKVAATMGINITVNGNDNETNCDVNISDPFYLQREAVQAETANWSMYFSLANFLPSVIMTLFYGIFSDRIGRRITFILPPIGGMLATLVDMAVIYFDLPIAFLFLEAIEYLFGSKFCCFSYYRSMVGEMKIPKSCPDAYVII